MQMPLLHRPILQMKAPFLRKVTKEGGKKTRRHQNRLIKSDGSEMASLASHREEEGIKTQILEQPHLFAILQLDHRPLLEAVALRGLIIRPKNIVGKKEVSLPVVQFFSNPPYSKVHAVRRGAL